MGELADDARTHEEHANWLVDILKKDEAMQAMGMSDTAKEEIHYQHQLAELSETQDLVANLINALERKLSFVLSPEESDNNMAAGPVNPRPPMSEFENILDNVIQETHRHVRALRRLTDRVVL